LAETSLSKPPAAARPGSRFTVADTTKNRGRATARRSATRFYFSNDRVKSANDSLAGGRSVPSLRAGKSSKGLTVVIVRVPVVPATYWVIACADARRAVAEQSERNNCRVSATQVFVRERGIKPPPPPPPAAPPQ
jgi:subtilase family serine protease